MYCLERRAGREHIFLPRDVVLQLVLPSAPRLFAFRRAVGSVVFGVTSNRIKNKKVPAIALTVPHPKWSRISRRSFHLRRYLFLQLDQLQQLSRRGLDQAGFV